jgi:hypothetical protein
MPGDARPCGALQGASGRGTARQQQETTLKIEVEIEGTTPLICNKFTDAAAEAASSGTRSAIATTDRGTPLEIAASKLYVGTDGKTFVIPQPNLLRCLVEGGRFHKVGKAQVTTAKSSMLFACIDIEGAEIEIIHRQPWKVDTRAVRIPATGGRILAHRPIFDDWRLSFVLEIDETIMSPKLMRQIVDDAGKRVGLGDFRPATKGPYGKFVVTRWQEQRVILQQAAE